MERFDVNEGWKFAEEYEEAMSRRDYDDSAMTDVRLPHTCKEVPFHYFDEGMYQMLCGYRRLFFVQEQWKGKRLLLTFEGVGHDAQVYVNGQKAGEHHTGYTAFTLDISDYVDYGAENILAVRVDTRESLNTPPFGFVVDYMTFGGIYREVYLEVKEPAYISDVFVRSRFPKGVYNATEASLISTVELQLPDAEEYYLRQTLIDGSREKLLVESRVGEQKLEIIHEVSEITLWSLENPKCYELKTELLQNGKVMDSRVDHFGFREAVFHADGFYLNGVKTKLRGLNRHQSYPYVGYAMPRSMQRQDAQILKQELGCNAVRTSHYPQSHSFVEACDELGLLVFMEFPGWQHIGDADWKEQACENVQEMITQYRNHPSIILWGVRINESGDDDAFYQKTNDIAHDLDDSRPTGGVRAHKGSHLLEDVYTYNDFVHDGTNRGCEPKKKVTSDKKKGYLVSEYNGHMYPTKAYDWEEHRMEHALRHANVLDAIAAEEDIAGSFGWCMFDYNTHKDFGSGDRICYHGVMDMFRNPKLASAVYASQQELEPVLELSSSMDIGEHPGCNRGCTYVFSNADSVKMYKNDRFIKEYTAADSPYTHLKHGPIVLDDFVGDVLEKNENFTRHQAKLLKESLNYVALHGYHYPPKIVWNMLQCVLIYHMKFTDAVRLYNKYVGDWGGTSTVYRFEGVWNGQVVKQITKRPMTKRHLAVRTSSFALFDGCTYDVAEVRIQMQDENDNLLHFYNDPVTFRTNGPIAVIGPDVVNMQGGMTGVYVKTTGEAGQASLEINGFNGESVTVWFDVSVDKSREL